MAKEVAWHDEVPQEVLPWPHHGFPVHPHRRADHPELQQGRKPRQLGRLLLRLVRGAVPG